MLVIYQIAMPHKRLVDRIYCLLLQIVRFIDCAVVGLSRGVVYAGS